MYQKAQQLLREKNLDAMVITDAYNIRYFSGFTGSTGMLYLTEHRQIMMTDFRYIEQANNQCKGYTIIDIKSEGYIKTLNGLMIEDNAKGLGFEDETITLKEFQSLLENGSQEELIPLGVELTVLRRLKEKWEIAYISRAQAIGDLAFSHILGVIKPGMTEIEIGNELEYFMKKQGASGLSFDTIVASGLNSALPHANPSKKSVENGDFITMDFGCIYEGYCSDMTRTIVVGKPSRKQEEIYHIVLEAQLAVLDKVKAGMTGKEVDALARDIIIKAGYGDQFGHGLGHSVGLFIHEEPRFSPKCDSVIEENTIMTVEPGIYIPGFGGVRIEDMIIVKKDGCVNLNNSPKELICL